jgi:hypothetical protein
MQKNAKNRKIEESRNLIILPKTKKEREPTSFFVITRAGICPVVERSL